MEIFTPQSIVLKGRILALGDVDTVFQLFSPAGERHWVPNWDPEILYPPGAKWEEGQLFRTREETGDATWIVTRLDLSCHSVRYHRVEPSRYVACIEVVCRGIEFRTSEILTVYAFVGLSAEGNQEIVAMTQRAYDEKMDRWAAWINGYLEDNPGRAAVRDQSL